MQAQMAQMVHDHWLLTLGIYVTAGIFIGYAFNEAVGMLKSWRTRRQDKLSDPDVERITGGWRIQDDPNRDWATGDNIIPAYTPEAYDVEAAARNILPATPLPWSHTRIGRFMTDTKPRTPEQYALEMNPRPYVSRHSADGYTEAQIKHLNTGTGSFPIVRSLSPDWRGLVSV